MRIVVTADTHFHAQWQSELARTVQEIADLRPDCVIHAGDVGETVDSFARMLDLLRLLHCPCLVLPGNHDLWSNLGVNSEALWAEILPRLTQEHEMIWLEDTIWTQAGLGVCGTIGWYDYTGRDPSINWTDAQYFMAKGQFMMDGLRINWPWNDLDFSAKVGQAFGDRLHHLESDPTIREILVVTHVPTFEATIVRKPDDTAWKVNNAYFYNLTLGKRIAASPKVTRVVSGHTHCGIKTCVEGAAGMIDVRVLAADYGKPAYLVLDYPSQGA